MTDLKEAIEKAANRWKRAWVDRDAVVLGQSLAPDAGRPDVSVRCGSKIFVPDQDGEHPLVVFRRT